MIYVTKIKISFDNTFSKVQSKNIFSSTNTRTSKVMKKEDANIKIELSDDSDAPKVYTDSKKDTDKSNTTHSNTVYSLETLDKSLDKWNSDYKRLVKKSSLKISEYEDLIQDISDYTENNDELSLKGWEYITTKTPLIVYRGTGIDKHQMKYNDTPLATTFDKNVAISFILDNYPIVYVHKEESTEIKDSKNGKDVKNVKKEENFIACCLYRFHLPIGSKVLAIREYSGYPHEEEILIKPNGFVNLKETSILKFNIDDFLEENHHEKDKLWYIFKHIRKSLPSDIEIKVIDVNVINKF